MIHRRRVVLARAGVQPFEAKQVRSYEPVVMLRVCETSVDRIPSQTSTLKLFWIKL